MKPAAYLLLLLGAAFAGCTSGSGTGKQTPTSGDAMGTVVRGSDLGPSLLQTLRSRVPSMTVSERAGECPRIQFRGPTSIRTPTSPSVYVDGTLMLDTCILTQISTMDIDYVDVYPSGNTSKPGVHRNPNGVILIYRVRE